MAKLVAKNTPPSNIFSGAPPPEKMLTATTQQTRRESHAGQTALNGALAECVVAALSDEFSRRIVSSTVDQGKTVQEISNEQAVPLSSCYRRARELVNQGLLVIERIVLTDKGKKYVVYRSSFKDVRISSNLETLSATVQLNPDVAEKFNAKWPTSFSVVEGRRPPATL